MRECSPNSRPHCLAQCGCFPSISWATPERLRGGSVLRRREFASGSFSAPRCVVSSNPRVVRMPRPSDRCSVVPTTSQPSSGRHPSTNIGRAASCGFLREYLCVAHDIAPSVDVIPQDPKKGSCPTFRGSDREVPAKPVDGYAFVRATGRDSPRARILEPKVPTATDRRDFDQPSR